MLRQYASDPAFRQTATRQAFTLVKLLVACQPKPWRRPIQRAFTLVELLVVIAIISVLAGLLLPTLENALAAANKVSCASNLRSIGIMSDMYADEFNNIYPISRNINTSFTPKAYPRTDLAFYEYTANLGCCPGGNSDSDPQYGHYMWVGGGYHPPITNMNLAYAQKLGICKLLRNKVAAPTRYALSEDIFSRKGITAYDTVWLPNHSDGINVVTAALNVHWYREDECATVPQTNPWGAVHPLEMLYFNWHSVYNATDTHYYENSTGQSYNMYSNVDNALIYRGWGEPRK